MANFFVAYDLRIRGQPEDYARVEAAIRRVDQRAIKVLYTAWHLQSDQTPTDIVNLIRTSLDAEDGLLVIKAASAAWSNDIEGSGETVLGRWSD